MLSRPGNAGDRAPAAAGGLATRDAFCYQPAMPSAVPEPRLVPLVRVAHRRVSDHRVFAVCEGEWVRPGPSPGQADKHIGPLATFACPDWCNVVAVTPDDELVLVWQHRFGTDALSLELPGGMIDRGEAPAAAARRELREETGFVADEVTPLLTVHPNPALQDNVCHTFLARGARLGGSTAFDEGEECEVALVRLRDSGELFAHPRFTHALSIAALHTYLARRGR